MGQAQAVYVPVEELKVNHDPDVFMRSLIRELSGLLEEVVGLEEAQGFISVVGQNMGGMMSDMYRQAWDVSSLDRDQVIQVLLDLKARIRGDFYVIKSDDDKVVMGNRVCPFQEKVKDRPSLCMMTSNVFGTIAAENGGYAKVVLEETIAKGDDGCRVVVYFNSGPEADAAQGREYYKSDD